MKKQLKPRGEIIVIHSKNPLVNLYRAFWYVFGQVVEKIEMELASGWHVSSCRIRSGLVFLPNMQKRPISAFESRFKWYVRRIASIIIALILVGFAIGLVVSISYYVFDSVRCSTRDGEMGRSGCLIETRK